LGHEINAGEARGGSALTSEQTYFGRRVIMATWNAGAIASIVEMQKNNFASF
jgi:hypothetical protein